MTHQSAAGQQGVCLRGHRRCASPAEVELIKRHLPLHLRLTRAEPGCLAFDVRPTADPLVWRVEERFRDRAAFDAHQRRTRASDWGAATAGIERRYQITGLERD